MWNPVPKRGMVRLWTWEALAHGAEVVSYFRWRQAVSAQEQFHAGLNLPGQQELSQGGREASWITRIQPQGQDFRYHELAFRWYEAARRLGLDIDMVRPGADLSPYSLVLVPSLPHVTDAAERAFSAARGTVLYGPRSGSRTRHHAIPPNLAPGPLARLLDLRVLEVSSLRPGVDGER